MYAGPYFQYKLTTKRKHERLYRVTDRTTLFSRHAVHRTGYSSDNLRGVDGRENACSPVAYVSDLIRVCSHVFQPLKSDHLKGTIDKEQTDRHTQTKNTKQKQRASHGPNLPPRKKTTTYSRVPKRCLLSFPTVVKLFVFFASCLVPGFCRCRSCPGSRTNVFRS